MAIPASAFQLDLESETPQAMPSQDAGSHKRLWFFQGMGLAGLMLMAVAASGAWPGRSEEPSGHDTAVAFLPDGFARPQARTSRLVTAGSAHSNGGFYDPSRIGGVAGKPSTVPRWTKDSPASNNGGLYEPARAGGVAVAPAAAAAPAHVPAESGSAGQNNGGFYDPSRIGGVAGKSSTLPKWTKSGKSSNGGFYDPSRIGGVAGKPSALPRWTKDSPASSNGGLYEPTRAGGVAVAPAAAAAPAHVPTESSSPGQNNGGFYDPSRIGGVAGKPSTVPRWTKSSPASSNDGLYEPAHTGSVATAPQWTPSSAQGVATAPVPLPTESGSQGQNFEDYMNKRSAGLPKPKWQRPGFYNPTRAGSTAEVPLYAPR